MDAPRVVGPTLVMSLFLAVAAAHGQVPVRTEILPIDSVTLSEADVLAGVVSGTPARIAGELRIPRTNMPASAVILMHGSNGIRTNAFRWADELLGLLSCRLHCRQLRRRRIADTATDQALLNTVAMTVGAYRALAVLLLTCA